MHEPQSNHLNIRGLAKYSKKDPKTKMDATGAFGDKESYSNPKQNEIKKEKKEPLYTSIKNLAPRRRKTPEVHCNTQDIHVKCQNEKEQPETKEHTIVESQETRLVKGTGFDKDKLKMENLLRPDSLLTQAPPQYTSPPELSSPVRVQLREKIIKLREERMKEMTSTQLPKPGSEVDDGETMSADLKEICEELSL
jgi:hypothetical protein